ncbi:MAG TPA: C40 family peptidase [Gaiellaceae bacterium]|jgi:cell wall-associated NlpC family hydrolase|nr:C40 family peptidase [Gaiellaceae bacterium]
MPKSKYARDRWEYPRMPVVPARIRRRRFALTIALTAIFFAGAALAAGAGTQSAHPSDDSTVAVATDATTTDTTATDTTPATTDAATTVVDTTTDEAATTDDATTLAATPAVAPAAAPADPAPAADPSDVVVKAVVPVNSNPTPAPAAQPTVRTTAVRTKKKNPPVRTLDRPLAIPYHAIIFDAQQWLNDNPGTPTGQAAVAIAMNYLGVPYRWGGAVPTTGFDCSGLVRFVYAQLGINLVHYAASQFAAFPKLSPAQLQPGDLVFFEPKMDGPGHVGLYIGNDQMIEAPHTGALVRIASVSGAAAQLGFLGAVRPYGNQLLGALTTLSVVESRPAAVFARMQ